jgi:hypothetical protein
MSSSRKKRDEARRRLERKPPPSARGSGRGASSAARLVTPDIHREIRHITERAQAEDARIVTLGNLVLFSTRTRDAWLLDPADHLALCLCRDGEPQPFRIVEAPDTFAIDWRAHFAIEGEAFLVHDRSGKVVVIHGYPTDEIEAACRGFQ